MVLIPKSTNNKNFINKPVRFKVTDIIDNDRYKYAQSLPFTWLVKNWLDAYREGRLVVADSPYHLPVIIPSQMNQVDEFEFEDFAEFDPKQFI